MFNAKKARQIRDNPPLYTLLEDIKRKAINGHSSFECASYFYSDANTLVELGFGVSHNYEQDKITITW